MLIKKHIFMNENDGTGGDLPAGDDAGQSGLPSDVDTQVSALEKFSNLEEGDFEKGLFKGRWNNPAEMADYIKNMEDKYSNLNRDIKDKEKLSDEQIQSQADEVKTVQLKEQTILDIAPQFIENGMQLTDDMKAKLIETGLTETEIKLGAYEYKERFEKAYNTVGGKEEYDSMMKWANDGLSDEEKLDFNRGLESVHSNFAIEGLHNRYKNDNKVSQDRVRGDIAPTPSTTGYSTKAELFRDKTFADSNRASANDKAKYKARLVATDPKVYS